MDLEQEIRIPVQKVMRQVTMNVTVTGIRIWKVRLTLGVWLIRLAAVVAGVGIRIDTGDS